jgi:ATP-dependent DNA helicase DinG
MHGKGTPRRSKLEREIAAYLMGKTDSIPVWAQANTEDCVDCYGHDEDKGRKYSLCDYAQARVKATQADVVVTSHAMIQCDLKVRRMQMESSAMRGAKPQDMEGILGKITGIIFDEAHQLSRMLYSETITPGKITFLDQYNILSKGMGLRKRGLMEHFLGLDAIKQKVLDSGYNESAEQWPWLEPHADLATELLKVWPTTAELLSMRQAAKDIEIPKESGTAQTVVESLMNGAEVLKRIQDGDNDGQRAFFLTTNRFNGFAYHVRNMQAEGWLLKALEDFKVAYISATLGTESRPTYVLDMLGITGVEFVPVESAFSYGDQMEWTWIDSAGTGKFQALDWFRGVLPGGTMALVMGHWTKNMLTEKLSEAGINVFVQADAHVDSKNRVNKGVLDRFKDAVRRGHMGDPVLVGTDSFATGLDLKGPLLTKLLIDDIREVMEPAAYKHWRYRWLAARGQSGRDDYELPERAIVLEQQVGRLIRTETDHGVVAVVFNMESERGFKKDIVLEAMRRFDGAQWVEPATLGERWK